MENDRKKRLLNSRIYTVMRGVATWMDRYHIDGLVGLIPGGAGDVVTSLISVVFVYFSMVKLRSVSLTLAVLSNILRDVLIGLVPFYIGDAIDFFNKSNVRNLQLVEGFINDDEAIVSLIKKRAVVSVLLILLFVAVIILMFFLLAWIVRQVGSLLFV